MSYFLGIDGGGTGCRAAVADGSGRIIGRGAAGPANISVETEGACANILAAARAALQDAGRGHLDELTAVLGLAGANVTAAARSLQAMLPFRRTRIVTDAVTAATGALVAEGKDLPPWHPLVCGDPEAVHAAGISQRGQMLAEEAVDPDDWEDHIIFRVG